ADGAPGGVEHDSPRRDGLCEVARPGARPTERDGELSRTRPDRHCTVGAALSRRTERRAPEGDSARTLGHAAGVRRRRVLPRVRPRPLRHRDDRRRRRGPDARAALMKRWFSPMRLAAPGAILLVATFAYGITQKSDDLLEVPDQAHSLNGSITVPGSTRQQDGGGIYYVDVVLRKASLLQSAFKLFRPEGADLIPQKDFVPTGLTYKQQLGVDQDTMKASQTKASVVALRALGLKFPAREAGVRVAAIQSDSKARGILQPQDIVVAADGHKVATRLDLFRALSRHRPGDV